MLEYKTVKVIEVSDWDKLVKETYGKPYNFQQQDGCKDRGTFDITIPSQDNDTEMNNEIPLHTEHNIMGVKFQVWLDRDPTKLIGTYPWETELWWERNFYPDIQTIANDLHEKGLIEAGDYSIKIDW